MKENVALIQYTFNGKESQDDHIRGLEELKKMGFAEVLASYQVHGMDPALFDDHYYMALELFMKAARKVGMKYWLEDYAPFPTGNANHAYEDQANSDKNKLFIDEQHFDLAGPAKGAVVNLKRLLYAMSGKALHQFARKDPYSRQQIAVAAYQTVTAPETAAKVILQNKTGIRLDDQVRDGFLHWDVPEGDWRVFLVYTTYESSGRASYMNLLSRDSVALEIEKVHKPLYEHLKDELGQYWLGFFYDEPEIGNSGGNEIFDYHMLPGRRTADPADCDTLPWSVEMVSEMEKMDPDWVLHLPFLFYQAGDEGCSYCMNYMDALTRLVRVNYNGQVYAFCRKHGIGYIGHVLEDENSHTRLGCGTGHYFREQYYQDEAGVDVIAGQVLPGRDQAAAWYGTKNADGEMYHYALAKLASSEAHINPLKHGRAFTECFAMYGRMGWKNRKFLIDHLLVNGINRMLVMEHTADQAAKRPMQMITAYMNRMCDFLRGTRPVIRTAVLYHAEAEWFGGEKAQKVQKPAAELARNQISYDIVPADIFTFPDMYQTDITEGLSVNGNAYGALLIPGCQNLPEAVKKFVRRCSEKGFPVFFSGETPMDLRDCIGSSVTEVSLENLAGAVAPAAGEKLTVSGAGSEWIRTSHLINNDGEYWLLHNEAASGDSDLQVRVKTDNQQAVLWDPNTDIRWIPDQKRLKDGSLEAAVHLGQFGMLVLCCRDEKSTAITISSVRKHSGSWTLEMSDDDFQPVQSEGGELPVPADHFRYGWYGEMIYKTEFTGDGSLPAFLDLGQVSDSVELTVNGIDCGCRYAFPYSFDVRKAIRSGKNEIVLKVTTSAANLPDDRKLFGIPLDSLTAAPYQLVEPAGILGPVRWGGIV